MEQADLVIVGGGMVGASLALSLKDTGLKIVLVESNPPGIDSDNDPSNIFHNSFDNRHLALSESSQRILNAMGLWKDLQNVITPIKRIHVSEQGRFAQSRMLAEDIGLDALGYVIIAKALGEKLWLTLREQSNIMIQAPAGLESFVQTEGAIKANIQSEEKRIEIQSRLLVFADGAQSQGREILGFKVNEKDYGQTAMVANVKPERPHNNTAYERFTKDGPFALLPNGPENMAMIYCLPTAEAQKHMQLTDDEYLKAANKRFGRRLGRFLSIGKRISYPLKLIEAEQHYQGRAMIIGNAAHTIHPNGAQGFNLGLRDVAGLRDAIIETMGQNGDIGSVTMLNRYVESRSHDQKRVIQFSDGLCQWFYNEDPLKKCARSMAITAIELFSPMKNHFALQASGLVGQQPQWVRHGA